MSSSVLLIGKPNCGKSLLFNRLTGLRQKVANFPGVTVEVKTGKMGDVDIRDFPGIYSLNAVTKDEEIAITKLGEAMTDPDLAAIICVLDATRLERSLFLGLQVRMLAQKHGKSLFFAMNMMDEIKKSDARLNINELEKELGQSIFGISARTGAGLDVLQEKITAVVKNPKEFSVTIADATADATIDLKAMARDLNQRFGPDTDIILKGQNFLDRFFLSGLFGGVIFLFTMLFLFQSIFTWATPAMDLVESVIGATGGFFSDKLPPGIFADFVNDAIFGGFGSFLVFVPQIFILTFIIGILEDSGYLARAAIICHRPLSWFGLSGKSFVPLLSGHACAIPAIFAARTIESPKKRLLTIAAIPLMSCSARLPVYSLFIAVLIPQTTFVGGFVGYQGLAFFALYAFGVFSALLVSAFLGKTIYKTESDGPFIIELPPYRLPTIILLLRKSLSASWAFITKAGAIIFMVTVVVWVLGYFPGGSGQLQTSWLASIGKIIEPVFEPLGLDWRYGVGILASFLAREVFVGTLGTMFGIEGAEENLVGLADQMQATGFTVASGIGLLVFYVIALQCVSTVAVIKKETGSARFSIGLTVGYGLLAYGLAIIAYQIAL